MSCSLQWFKFKKPVEEAKIIGEKELGQFCNLFGTYTVPIPSIPAPQKTPFQKKFRFSKKSKFTNNKRGKAPSKKVNPSRKKVKEKLQELFLLFDAVVANLAIVEASVNYERKLVN